MKEREIEREGCGGGGGEFAMEGKTVAVHCSGKRGKNSMYIELKLT